MADATGSVKLQTLVILIIPVVVALLLIAIALAVWMVWRKFRAVKIRDILAFNKNEAHFPKVKVWVTQLKVPSNTSKKQVGELSDGTGTIPFISWKSLELPTLELGKGYVITNVKSKIFRGRLELQFTKDTTIKRA
ncbi:MAG: hypothetical protein ACUVXI_14360 [bacterium]